MSDFHTVALVMADSLALMFAAAALTHLFSAGFLVRRYRAAGYGHGFHRAVGLVLGLAALFLTIPQTRIWGGALGGLILFLAATQLLYREKYLCAVPAMLLMLALAPAMA